MGLRLLLGCHICRTCSARQVVILTRKIYLWLKVWCAWRSSSFVVSFSEQEISQYWRSHLPWPEEVAEQVAGAQVPQGEMLGWTLSAEGDLTKEKASDSVRLIDMGWETVYLGGYEFFVGVTKNGWKSRSFSARKKNILIAGLGFSLLYSCAIWQTFLRSLWVTVAVTSSLWGDKYEILKKNTFPQELNWGESFWLRLGLGCWGVLYMFTEVNVSCTISERPQLCCSAHKNVFSHLFTPLLFPLYSYLLGTPSTPEGMVW